VRRVVRLRAPGGPEQLAVEDADRPLPGPGEALVRVHAAAITRGELEWPVDRLPAIPSYELSGVVEEVGSGVDSVAAGDEVFALTPFDRDGVAADYTAVPPSCWSPGRGRSDTTRAPRSRCPRSPPGRGCSTTAGSLPASAC
jgi:NADPH:quinone reductase-like Zn-dependent oxidoreductase